ncbi:MAG TPA: hypothetical protein VGJ31_01140 [Dongiaceae bacterium]
MPWLTPVVFKQGPEEPLTRLPCFDDGPNDVRFRHIVHIYRDRATPENTAVQSITLDTIRQARRFCAPRLAVSPVMVTFADDADLVPADMGKAPHLTRQIGDAVRFQSPRLLPLLFDVIGNGFAADVWLGETANSVEYVVLTNSDIHLQPAFYSTLATLIRQGYDVISVNRRTIDAEPGDRVFSPLFMAEPGKDHPGFDCFVFPASMIGQFVINDACCGAGGVMRSLLFNLVAASKRFLMLTRPNMTFHLGDDVPWANPKYLDYQLFNYNQALMTLAKLVQNPDTATRLEAFINIHEDEDYRIGLANILQQARWFRTPDDAES